MVAPKARLKRLLFRALKRPALERGLVWAHARAQPHPELGRRLVKLTPQPQSYRFDEVRCVERDDGRWEFRPANYFQWHHYFQVRDPVLEALERLVEPGDHVFDVGANIGLYAVRMARVASARGRVVAFEPSSETRYALETHVRLNDARTVEVRPEALGNEDGEAILSGMGSEDAGKFSLRGAGTESGTPVRSRRLDSLVPEMGVERLDLIKIDVEGFEPELLDGAQSTLSTRRPAVVIEATPAWYGGKMDMFRHGLGPLMTGEHIWFEITDRGVRPFDVRSWARALDVRGPQRNLIAVQAEKARRLKVVGS